MFTVSIQSRLSITKSTLENVIILKLVGSTRDTYSRRLHNEIFTKPLVPLLKYTKPSWKQAFDNLFQHHIRHIAIVIPIHRCYKEKNGNMDLPFLSGLVLDGLFRCQYEFL